MPDHLAAALQKMRGRRRAPCRAGGHAPAPRAARRPAGRPAARRRPGAAGGPAAAGRAARAGRRSGPASCSTSWPCVKLNGGLGTSMGLSGPKSLLDGQAGHQLPGRDRGPGARAARAPRGPAAAAADELGRRPAARRWRRCAATTGCASRSCRSTSCRAASRSCAPTTCSPVQWPANPELEWCPPGHGDLYTALAASGTLDALLDAGLRWAFVSNSDNLGALADVRLAAWIADERGAVRDGGGARHAGRPQGRPPRPPRRAGRAAGDRAGARRATPRSPTSSGGATTTPTTCGSTCGRCGSCRPPTRPRRRCR